MLPNYPYAHSFFLHSSLFLESDAPLRTGRHRLRVSLADVHWDGTANVRALFSAITGYNFTAPAGVVLVAVTPVLNGGGELVAAVDLVLDVYAPSVAFSGELLRVFGLGPPLSVATPGTVVLPPVTPTENAPITVARGDYLPLDVAWSYSPDIRALVTFNTHSLTFPTPARNYRVDVDFSALGTFSDALFVARVGLADGDAQIEASENVARKTPGKASFTIFAPDDGDPVYTIPLTVNMAAQVAGFGWSSQVLAGAAAWSAPALL